MLGSKKTPLRAPIKFGDDWTTESASIHDIARHRRRLPRLNPMFVLDFQDYKSENALEELLLLKILKLRPLLVRDGLKKEIAISEGNMASLQALREEQAFEERREEKHARHNASKMVCFHGKGSGIRTKSSRGVDNSCKNPGAIDHDASVFAGILLSIIHALLDQAPQDEMRIIGCETLFDFVNNQTNSCHDVNAFESRFICLPLISWSWKAPFHPVKFQYMYCWKLRSFEDNLERRLIVIMLLYETMKPR
ncbi:hypothetical protein FNV43_RR07768 [Rhamnella rubrinervis]|uniref:Uncharacterized protein n=1 Tax=Rhamnella rubrinervis TaxID=2594499 RepID=A0A8K0MMN6_9ROSA|nr:hypothetical protein FNV43_RR07768 [Rhamnella rubrinervis]